MKLANAERAKRLKIVAKDTVLPLITRILHSQACLGASLEICKHDSVWQLIDPVMRASWTVDMPGFAALIGGGQDVALSDESLMEVKQGYSSGFFSDSLSKMLRYDSHQPALDLSVKILTEYEKLQKNEGDLDAINEGLAEVFDEILCTCRMVCAVWLREPGAYESSPDDVWAFWSEEALEFNNAKCKCVILHVNT